MASDGTGPLGEANNCFANGDLNVGSSNGSMSDSTATGVMATESNAGDAMSMLILSPMPTRA